MATDVSTYDIVPTALAVKAMRDNGYKNAAYAVAELMDNSIQAQASLVELLCADEEVFAEQRTRRRISQVAVLDDGKGMDAPTLQRALQFGNGYWEETEQHEGMGRFGMGLPSASISQCRKVEVWSWQGNPDEALYSYIDLEKVERGEMREVPAPERAPIPELWREASSNGFADSGTLVVWSSIDRCLWRTSKALIDNSEELIGRMYRYWIDRGDVRIRLTSFLVTDPAGALETWARPNDPLYLMAETSCPEPFHDKAMFKPFPSPEHYEETWKVRFRGEEHEVKVRLSIATEEARADDPNDGREAGSRPHGAHARRNAGVSVVRAGRELELDLGWIITYDPRERWWGVEVSFEPGLDDLFGVSNNKQFARNFAEAAKIDAEALAKEHGGSITQARIALEEEGDPIGPLLDVIWYVERNIKTMRQQLKKQSEGRRGGKRHDGKSAEERATAAVRRRQEEGHKGRSDAEEEKDAEERKAELTEQLERDGYDKEQATELAAETIDRNLKYRMEISPLEAGAFFSVQSRGGVLIVTLDSEHPAYELLLGARDPAQLPDDVEELKSKLRSAQEGLEMMLFAWARYEDEQVVAEKRRQAQNVRHDWGRMAESFLEVKGGS